MFYNALNILKYDDFVCTVLFNFFIDSLQTNFYKHKKQSMDILPKML